MGSKKRDLFGQGFAREIRDNVEQARSAFEAVSDLLKEDDPQLFKEAVLRAIVAAALEEPARRALSQAEYLTKELEGKGDK